MRIGNKDFDLNNKCYVMGILNVTPDSFSDGGKWNEEKAALIHVREMIDEGAEIIDVGGESTRPGHTMISDEEEINRVVPIIKAIKSNFDIPVSIDTYKSQVAEAAIKAGADMVNDVSGLKYDKDLAKVISNTNVPCCLMHNRAEANYDDFLKDLVTDMKETLDIAEKAGISKDKIVLDPGVGFGKTKEQNMIAVLHIEALKDLGYPVLLGTSRKSFIGKVLDLPVDERVEGTLATSVIGVLKGASIIRVHDIKENYRVIKMTEAIMAADLGGRDEEHK